MNIYWREWIKTPLTKEEARKLADDFRHTLANIRAERVEMEKIAKRIEKATG
jgi:chemotaxis regulatin CheY-phosphate phosphatase CheZ